MIAPAWRSAAVTLFGFETLALTAAYDARAQIQIAQAEPLAKLKSVFDHDKIVLVGQIEKAFVLQAGGLRYVLTVKLPYDPQSSQTADYYDRLYPAILKALGGTPYTLRDITDDLEIRVDGDKNGTGVKVTFDPLH